MKREIKVRQHDQEDCAVACIASVCSYYGLNLPLVTIRDACGTSKEGTSLKGITDAAKHLGLDAKAFKSSEKKILPLMELPKPIIMHMKRDDNWLHFIVLYEMNNKRCTILDPEDGQMHKISNQEIEEHWSGYLVALAPSAEFEKGDKKTNIFARFKVLFSSNKKELILALIGSIVYILVGLSTSVFLQQIVDKVLPQKSIFSLSIFGAIMLLLFVCSLFIGYYRILFTVRASVKIDAQLIMGYVRKLFLLPVSFFSNRSSGELNSRIADAYRIRAFLSGRLIVIFISIFSLLLSFGLLFTYYWKLAVLTMLFVPMYCILYYISNRINKKVNKEMIEAAARFQEMSIDTLSSIRTVKYFGAGEQFTRKIERGYVAMAQKIYRGGKNISAFSTATDAISKMLTFMILIVGTIFIFRSELTIGEMISFYSITTFFSSPLTTLVESNNQITEAQIASQRLFEIMDLDQEDNEEILDIELCLDEEIIVENLSFSFPGRMTLLENLSFKLVPGKINVLVGDNGSGKSTLAALLMKGYQPQSGCIKLGKTDIRQISSKKWREYISIVPQQVDLFNGTILENIVPNQSSPDIKKVLKICDIVGLSGILEKLPKGLLSKTGEHGSHLSGGEKQKVALARALYREPKALILDEASSSLDAGSRKEISDLIHQLSESGMMIISISHEADNILYADNIIKL